MQVYADTSFLAALYLFDDLTPEANAYMSHHPHPLVLTELQQAEARNAFRLRVAQKRSSSEEVYRALIHFDRDIAEGIFVQASPDWPRTFREFEQISQKYSERGGHRFVDLLHVAAALNLEARTFLTFDQRQARLAKAVGLKKPL
jgi:predicted nucleic acid-binding protein